MAALRCSLLGIAAVLVLLVGCGSPEPTLAADPGEAVQGQGLLGKLRQRLRGDRAERRKGRDGDTASGSPGALGLQQQSLDVDGLERTYYVHVPSSASPNQPVPLVFVFHGGGSTVTKTVQFTEMNELADREGFIVVYPVGTGGRKQEDQGTWNAGGDPPLGYAEQNSVDDLAFVRTILEELESSYAIDPKGIYATGISKGGMFVYWLACNMSETFAAIAPVAATMTAPPDKCHPSEPVSVLHIHGDEDANVPLEGGRGPRTQRGANWRPPVEGVEFWARSDRCSVNDTESRTASGQPCTQYPSCASGATVAYCVISDHGHAWPGMSTQGLERAMEKRDLAINTEFDASEYIWEFFEANPKS